MKKESETPLRAGFACVDITPADSLPMGGYVARTEPAAGVHDRLCAKAAAFRYGDTSAILVSLDILHVSDRWSRRVREAISQQTGLPPKNVLTAATHTHSGPAVFSPITGRTEPIVRYEENLLNNCVGAAEGAFTSMEPARMRVCSVISEGVAMNRRHPLGPVDDLLSVVRIEDPSGKVKGHLVSFSCHPTVMPALNLDYSADLFGVSAREVEKKFNNSTCIMFNGAAGDVSTRLTRRKQTWAELERLGKKLARQILEASRSTEPAEAGPISAKTFMMKFPFRKVPPVEKALEEYEEAITKIHNSTLQPGGYEDLRLARSLVDGAVARLVLSKIGGWEPLFGTDTAEVELQMIRIGDVVICGLPGEFFGNRGAELKSAALPKFGLVIGYANGYWGYVVPPKEAAKGGYEALMAPLHASDEPKIVRKAKELIRETKKSSRRKRGAANV